MAVPKFYRWLYRNHKHVFGTRRPKRVSSLWMDLNSLIHQAAGKFFGYAEGVTDEYRENIAGKTIYELQQLVFTEITDQITAIVELLDVEEMLYIAVDGVAPLAKISQQRQRRYETASKRKPKGVQFDSNAITPGTPFMHELDNHIEAWIKKKRETLPNTVIYSSYRSPGEGEHKIMDYIRSNSNQLNYPGEHIIYGQDADLAMLSLLLPLENLQLMKIDGEYTNYISVDAMREAIKEELLQPTAINDFIVLMFFIGNDFLPRQSSFDDIELGIDRLFEVYLKVNKPLTDKNGISWLVYSEIIDGLAAVEKSLLEELSKIKFEYPSVILQSSIEQVTTVGRGKAITKPSLNYNRYHDLWYENEFDGRNRQLTVFLEKLTGYEVNLNKINDMINAYLTGVSWIYLYYTQGINYVNINYMYEYFHAPLFSDLSKINYSEISERLGEYEYDDLALAFEIVEQMVSVIPPASKKILPAQLLPLYQLSSPILDLLPNRFEKEISNAHKDDKFIIYIPFISHDRIIAATASLNLTDDFLENYLVKEDYIASPRTTKRQPRQTESTGSRSRARGRGEYTRGRGGYTRGRGGYTRGGGEPTRGYTRGRGEPTRGYTRGQEESTRGFTRGEYTRGRGEYTRGRGEYARGRGEYTRGREESTRGYSRGRGEYTSSRGEYTRGSSRGKVLREVTVGGGTTNVSRGESTSGYARNVGESRRGSTFRGQIRGRGQSSRGQIRGQERSSRGRISREPTREPTRERESDNEPEAQESDDEPEEQETMKTSKLISSIRSKK